MAGTYLSKYASGTAVDAALDKAESAVQPQSGTATKLGGANDGSGWGISTILFAKLTLTLTAGASCLLSGFDMHGEIDAFGSNQEYVK